MPPVSSIPSGPDTISILITTDNHVGYNENHLVLGDDGWKTFEEIATIAQDRDVDMILQAGDLFHINKPSKKSLYHVIKTLRDHCLGDKPCELELLNSDVTANYEDPNINVAVPVFAINGNHDDATGDEFLLALDVLAATGLINYFGKVPNNEDITVKPILFQKGNSRLALYGLSFVKDERLHRSFRDENVKFLRPDQFTNDWFNLMAVHQNHSQHTLATSFLPESFLPSFLDLLIWGHEHECIPFPSLNPDTGFDTLQPGSSIATSLSEGETALKHVFLLKINKRDYHLEPILLKTIRPFVMREVSLLEQGFVPGPGSKLDIAKYLVDEVEKLIDEANDLFRANNPDQEVPLPLVRLRVEYSGDYEVENARRFSNRFVGKIANVDDVVLYYKKKELKPYADVKQPITVDVQTSSTASIEDHLKDFLDQANLSIIPTEGINDAVSKYIQQEDKQMLNEFIERTIEASTQLLLEVELDDSVNPNAEEDVRSAFKNVLSTFKRENILKNKMDELEKTPQPKPKARKPVSARVVEEINSDSDEYVTEVKPKPKPRARKTTKSTKSTSKTKSNSLMDDIISLGR